MSVRSDYDDDPGRYRLGMDQARTLLAAGVTPLLERVWQVIPPAGDREIVADIGCADGALAAARPPGRAGRLVGLDRSMTMLRAHPRPAVQADAVALPLRDHSVTAVVMVNMLYHLPDPVTALRAARRALAPGGVAVLATVSRRDSPELAPVWRPQPSTFDAEYAACIAGQVFPVVGEEWWDAPLLTLPDRAAIRDYLIARQMPAAQARRASDRLTTPLAVTKRGVMLTCRG